MTLFDFIYQFSPRRSRLYVLQLTADAYSYWSFRSHFYSTWFHRSDAQSTLALVLYKLLKYSAFGTQGAFRYLKAAPEIAF